MKKSELRRLLAQYRTLKQKQAKSRVDVSKKLTIIERRYYHETGRSISENLC
ncbi:MAG: hypothetical protein QXW91_04800 [Candidatus Nitrosotenuis sp.]